MDALSPREAARAAPDEVALVSDDRTFSFAELWREAERLLPEVAHARSVSFVAEPRWQTIARVWACLEAGAPMVPLHPRWTAGDRTAAVARIEASSARLGGVTAVLFSSGSTAAPRGVLLSRAAFLASAAAHTANLPFEAGDRWLLALPFAHVGGLSILTRALVSRTAVVLARSNERHEILRAIERHRVSLLSLVPTVAHDLVAMGGGHVLASPRAVLIGGARAPAVLRKKLKSEGVRVLATYGMTETCSQIATESLTEASAGDDESSGRPLAGFELRIVDARGDGGRPGERGRIEVRGPALMSGYLGEAPRDGAAFFDTRDIGSIDATGRVLVVGRADETIITGGENVYPSEVEAVLGALPGVREAAAFGIPDARWGEVVAIALAIEPGAALEEIWRGARERLASFRVPRRYAIVEALPRSANGKLDARALRALALRAV